MIVESYFKRLYKHQLKFGKWKKKIAERNPGKLYTKKNTSFSATCHIDDAFMKFTHTKGNSKLLINFQKQNTDAKVVTSIYFKQLQIVSQTLKPQQDSYRTLASCFKRVTRTSL